MTLPEPSPKPFSFTDPRQKRIFTRLQNLVGPGPAQFYRDACMLMASDNPPSTTTHLVAHLLRDIESALRDVLETFIDPNDLKRLKERTGQISHKDEVLVIMAALELSDDVELRKLWLGLTGKKNVRALHSRAHRNALDSPRPLDDDFRSFWSEMELILDKVLNKFDSKYLKIHERLSVLKAKQKPATADAEFLKDHISNNFAAFSYFFQDLENPAWLISLDRVNLFSSPPASITNQEDNTIAHPLWPQSRYLIRMASASPDIVVQIALKIETENINVQSDLIEMACSLPASQAVLLVPKFCKWLRKPFFFLVHTISPLVVHLVDGDEVDGAITLSKEILSFDDAENKSNKNPNNYETDAKPRIESYEYTEFLREAVPAISKKEPHKTFIMVMELLSDALDRGKYGKVPGYRDYSEIWLPAIEPHPQNAGHVDTRSSLVSAINDATTTLLEQSPELFEKIIQEFENQKWTIFHRLALHFIREFGNTHMDLVSKRILDKELFDNPSYYHEYMLLVGKYFKNLKPKEKNIYLGWIKSGAEGKDNKEYWQLKRLTIIKDDLPKRWRARFEDLTKKYGVVEHPDLLAWSTGVRWGPTSPLSREQIETMDLNELVSYLQKWKQPSDFTMDSPEGISRTLTSVVTNNPERFAQSALIFTKAHPTYVRGILVGFREALKADKLFQWEPVLELVRWIVVQGRLAQEQIVADQEDLDPDWGWTRTEISHLLESALNDDKNPIDEDKQPLIWEIIEPITKDPNPTLADEEKSQMDPATNSLNTTRGVAFHALFAYALWRKKNLQKKNGQSVGLSDMPEVLTTLDEHLNLEIEPSLTIRSVYGWKYYYLLWLDRNWALSNRSRIFPPSENEKSHWKAAWNAFISFTNPNSDLLQNLQSEHLLAVGRLDKVENEVGWGINAGERLAEHLMIHYAWGAIDLRSNLMQEFWSKADVSFRSHALHFVGTSIKDKPSADVIKRFQELWEFRMKEAGTTTQGIESAEEIKKFSWWFSSGVFPEEWSLSQLDHLLSLSFNIKNNHFVFERLATLSEAYSFRTITILSKLLEEETPWEIAGSKEDIEIIFKNCLGSQDKNASKIAQEIINRLAAKGYTYFTGLLD